MRTRAIEVLGWHPEVPGSARHASRIRAVRPGGSPPPDLSFGAVRDLDWQDRSRCAEVDPALFHPQPSVSAAPALRVCASCEVRARCLEWALETGEQWGVLGGTTERERQQMRVAREDKGLAA